MLNLYVYFLVSMFGSSTWLTINAIWVELSLYTNKLPEGWSLPSYLALVIQIACLCTLVYGFVHRRTKMSENNEKIIFLLLSISTLSMLALAFLWDQTVQLFGSDRSIALIVLTFFMAVVSAASNVLFLPYMATFHSAYLTAYFVGMSFSSLLPSILKLIQGVGNYDCKVQDGKITPVQTEPLFPVRTFNLLMFVWMCAATASFALLQLRYNPKKESSSDGQTESNAKSSPGKKGDGNENEEDGDEEHRPLNLQENGAPVERNFSSSPIASADGHKNEKLRFWLLIGSLTVICAEMNTIVPSIQSYATLAYSMLTYHLALTLSNISHPLANFLPLWAKPRSLFVILTLTFACTLGTSLIFILAIQSPDPIFRDSSPLLGSVLSIGLCIFTGFFCSYLRTHLVGLIKGEMSGEDGESRLFWSGVFMQLGSFFGAAALFPLINIYGIFRKRNPCDI